MARLQWSDLFAKGTLIKFVEHMWRARLQLTARDLGIEESEEVQKALSFGTQRLAPKEEFEALNRISSAWKSDIEYHSLAFVGYDGFRFVPDDQVKILTGKIENHKKAFEKEVRAFIGRYEKMKEKHLPILEQALKDACRTPEAAFAAFSRVESEYPSAGEIASKFGLEWSFLNLNMPTSPEAAKAAKNATPEIKKIVESMIGQLRRDLKEKVEGLISVAGRIDTNKKEGFNERSINAALAVLDRVESLNVLEDVELNQQVRRLRNALESGQNGSLQLKEVVDNLVDARKALEVDQAKAVEIAEKKLMGMGDRKIKWK